MYNISLYQMSALKFSANNGQQDYKSLAPLVKRLIVS